MDYQGMLSPVDGDYAWAWIYPGGVPTKVLRDVCRCPITEVGDACPVHQHPLPTLPEPGTPSAGPIA